MCVTKGIQNKEKRDEAGSSILHMKSMKRRHQPVRRRPLVMQWRNPFAFLSGQRSGSVIYYLYSKSYWHIVLLAAGNSVKTEGIGVSSDRSLLEAVRKCLADTSLDYSPDQIYQMMVDELDKPMEEADVELIRECVLALREYQKLEAEKAEPVLPPEPPKPT